MKLQIYFVIRLQIKSNLLLLNCKSNGMKEHQSLTQKSKQAQLIRFC